MLTTELSSTSLYFPMVNFLSEIPECDPELVIIDKENGKISEHNLKDVSIKNLAFNPQRSSFYWNKENVDLLERLVKSYNYDWKKIVPNFCKKTGCFFHRNELQNKNIELKRLYLGEYNYRHIPYNTEESKMLLELNKIYGNDWNLLAKYFVGRTPESLRNKFYYLTSTKKTNTKISKSSKRNPARKKTTVKVECIKSL